MTTDEESMMIKSINENPEILALMVHHYFRAEKAKRLMREAGYGVTGTDILETTKLVLEYVDTTL